MSTSLAEPPVRPVPRSQASLRRQRAAFHLPADVHYLDCAYMSPLLRVVERAGVAGVRRKRAPHALGPEVFFDGADRVRALFARLVNAPSPARIAIVPGVSYGIAVVARNIPLARGQTVVVAAGQFPSNVYAWRRACADRGAELRTVRPPSWEEARGAGVSRGAAWNERLLDAIGIETAVVMLEHVHWTDGTRFDLEAIGARAREVGAALVVDGIQSVGALPFDVERVRPDALVCAAYKWLLGPVGVGVAYFGPRFDDGVPLEETWLGRAGSDDFRALADYSDRYRPGAARYDASGRGNFVLLPMLAAALEQLLASTPAAVQTYCATLVEPLARGARSLGYQVEDDAWRASHILGLRAPASADAGALQRRLAARRVVVSARGQGLRVSPHVYNDAADLAMLLEALRGS